MKRGLLGGYDEEPQGLFGQLQQGVMNPMFLGGAALLSGEGMGGAMRGMQLGQGFQDDQRKRAMEQQQRQDYQGLLGDPSVTGALPPEMLKIAQMAGPQNGPEFLAKYLDPARGADLEYKKAMTQKALREAANGGDLPSNVREWQYYQSLSPQQQQQYLTMKRAEKWLDTGTKFVSPAPGNPGADPRTMEKNVAEEARLKQAGEATGKAAADLPRALSAGDRMLEQIQGVQTDPNLPNVTGWQGFLPTFNPRNVDTEERIAQLGGGAFLQAFESLKGGGQITEIEGKKATDALARLTNLRQSDAGFQQALKDFQSEVMRLQGLAKQRAGGGGAPAAPAPAPGGWSIKRVD